jgi:hypothetical protein
MNEEESTPVPFPITKDYEDNKYVTLIYFVVTIVMNIVLMITKCSHVSLQEPKYVICK